MTVSELIAKLQKIDGNKKVAVMDIADMSDNYTIITDDITVYESCQDVKSDIHEMGTHPEDVVYISSGLDY